MRICENCKANITGDGRSYPGSNILPDQPRGIVCEACEKKLIAEVHLALATPATPKTIEERLLHVAQELRAINLLPLTKEQNDILTDIDDSNLDRAISKLTGNWDPTPKDEDAWSGGICENH